MYKKKSKKKIKFEGWWEDDDHNKFFAFLTGTH